MTHPKSGASSGQFDILIVDDSAVVRQRHKAILESDPRFHAILAADPYEAVAILGKIVPAVIVLDVMMPRMDGLTFLKKLMRQHPMPVVLCTDQPERAVSALEFGAVEVVAKPDPSDPESLVAFAARLIESVGNAARIDRGSTHEAGDLGPSHGEDRHEADVVLPKAPHIPRITTERVIAIGVSTGGVQAIQRLLASFPPDAPGIVIVQHMPTEFTSAFARRLHDDPNIQLVVTEAEHHDPIRPGHAMVIPGRAHGLVRRTGTGYRVELRDGPPVCRHRPSVEVLFRSTAQAAGPRGAGLILTGMGDDGAGGLLEMREAGALTIAQDEATCVVFGMPREAIRRNAAMHVAPLDRIADLVMPWARTAETGER